MFSIPDVVLSLSLYTNLYNSVCFSLPSLCMCPVKVDAKEEVFFTLARVKVKSKMTNVIRVTKLPEGEVQPDAPGWDLARKAIVGLSSPDNGESMFLTPKG